jgi:DNA-binding NarL/FixJ family response regulator
VVGLANTVPEAAELTQLLCPDVVLLSTSLLGGNGAVGDDAGLFGKTKVLMLSEASQEMWTLQTLQRGARGFLLKSETAKVPAAIQSVQRGEAILTPRLTGWMLDTLLH